MFKRNNLVVKTILIILICIFIVYITMLIINCKKTKIVEIQDKDLIKIVILKRGVTAKSILKENINENDINEIKNIINKKKADINYGTKDVPEYILVFEDEIKINIYYDYIEYIDKTIEGPWTAYIGIDEKNSKELVNIIKRYL